MLPGLPGTGPRPEQFSATGGGTHREGLVVRFEPETGSPWVGNFVIAGGQGYIVHPENRQSTHLFGGAVMQTYRVVQPDLLVVGHQGIAFEAIGREGRVWHTPRLSWDGFRTVRIENGRIMGEAWNPIGGLWHEFEVDVATGRSSGGSYDHGGG
jgi:hypothetical protein